MPADYLDELNDKMKDLPFSQIIIVLFCKHLLLKRKISVLKKFFQKNARCQEKEEYKKIGLNKYLLEKL